MNRRSFLATLGLTTGAIAVPELWTPKRTFFLPPRGGWLDATDGYGYRVIAEYMDEVLVVGALYVEVWGAGGKMIPSISYDVDIQRA